ncbi:MAG: asparagine synthase (glutamine-hydrolyzing) [Terracidiphilus sp.]
MCGIAGMAGIKDVSLLQEMLRITAHRGPDDSGVFVSDGNCASTKVAIGNNRLKILDLSSAGHQPMANPERTVWVVYNGEIFNYPDLRDELAADGHAFRSQTDTEVLPLLWLKYGARMVDRLNGMFAFAIWDSREDTLFIARDRMGVKPLYYAIRGERLYFGSEIKSLLLAPEVGAEIDLAAMREFLALQYVPHPNTMFRGIQKLSPGCALTWRNGATRIDRFWDGSRPVPRLPGTERDLVHQCREVLRDSVRRQLMSDVPVGFFLSGGLDSSTLLACASEVHTGPLRCYTISFRKEHAQLEQTGADAYYAKRVAKRFGAECQEIVVDPDVASLLPKVIWHLDDAISDPAAIATWLICSEAKSSATVLLSGQGGDELFAGYRVHLVDKYPRWLRHIPAGIRQKVFISSFEALSRNANRVPGISPGLMLALCRYGINTLRQAGLPPPRQFAGMRSCMTDDDLRSLMLPDAFAASRPPDQMILEHFRTAADLDSLDQLLYVDQQTFLPDINLAYSDKLSMAASIEARVPLLDNAVVDFMRGIPGNLKMRGYNRKYILKRAMEDIVPHEVIARRKAGFSLPVRSWLRNELREMVGDLLSEKRVRERGIFHPGAVAKMIEENQSGTRDATLPIWALLTLELWQQTFVDSPTLRRTGNEGVFQNQPGRTLEV